MTNEKFLELTHRATRMQSKGIENPYEAFDYLFESFTLQECREQLWELYMRCVMSYDRERTVHEKAFSTLLFFNCSEMLIEAAWLIHHERNGKE